MTHPLTPLGLTVVMTTYEGDWDKLPGALAALADKLHPGLDLEVSVAVNHETFQHAYDLVEQAGLDHPVIVWDQTGKNYGEAIGRNLAIFNASKELIAAGDPDDRWRPGGLSRLALAITSHNVDLAVGRNARFTEAEELAPAPSIRDLQGIYRTLDMYRHLNWEEHPFRWHPMTFVARSSLLRKQLGWPAFPFGADLGFLLGMMTPDPHTYMAVVPEIVRNRVNSPDQVTARTHHSELGKWVDITRLLTEEQMRERGVLVHLADVAAELAPRTTALARRTPITDLRGWPHSAPVKSRSLSPTAHRVPARQNGVLTDSPLR